MSDYLLAVNMDEPSATRTGPESDPGVDSSVQVKSEST